MTLPATSNPARLVLGAEVRALTGYSSVQLWRLEKAGRFPQRIVLSRSRVAWRYGDVIEWLTARAASRQAVAQ